MQTSIKIKFSTGKEIELTEQEFEELKQKFTPQEPPTYYTPMYYPQYPYRPWDWNKVTCNDSSTSI